MAAVLAALEARFAAVAWVVSLSRRPTHGLHPAEIDRDSNPCAMRCRARGGPSASRAIPGRRPRHGRWTGPAAGHGPVRQSQTVRAAGHGRECGGRPVCNHQRRHGEGHRVTPARWRCTGDAEYSREATTERNRNRRFPEGPWNPLEKGHNPRGRQRTARLG